MHLQISFPCMHFVSFHVASVLGDWHFAWYMYFTLMMVALMYPHISFVTLHANSAKGVLGDRSCVFYITMLHDLL